MFQRIFNIITSKSVLVLLFIYAAFATYKWLSKPSEIEASSNSKIQKINDNSEAYEAKFEYLNKEFKAVKTSKDSSEKALIALKEEFDKYKDYIAKKTQVSHEKYTAIHNLSGLGTFDFFAGVKTGNIGEGK